jgi:hypothetical protein
LQNRSAVSRNESEEEEEEHEQIRLVSTPEPEIVISPRMSYSSNAAPSDILNDNSTSYGFDPPQNAYGVDPQSSKSKLYSQNHQPIDPKDFYADYIASSKRQGETCNDVLFKP